MSTPIRSDFTRHWIRCERIRAATTLSCYCWMVLMHPCPPSCECSLIFPSRQRWMRAVRLRASTGSHRPATPISASSWKAAQLLGRAGWSTCWTLCRAIRETDSLVLRPIVRGTSRLHFPMQRRTFRLSLGLPRKLPVVLDPACALWILSTVLQISATRCGVK